MEKPSKPQKLQEKGNGRDDTVQYIIKQLNPVSGQPRGDVSSAISAVHTHRGANQTKKREKKMKGKGRVFMCR